MQLAGPNAALCLARVSGTPQHRSACPSRPRATPWVLRKPHQQRRVLSAAAAGERGQRADRYANTAPPSQASQAAVGASAEPSVLSSREYLLRLVPLQQFPVVGVSFEGRQEVIPQLHKGQAVAFVREPDNPHDPHAVADLCFGAVGSFGQQADTGLWGLSVLVQPTVPPVEVYALPASLRQCANLTPHLGPAAAPALESLKAAALAAAGSRCAVTGARQAAAVERWGWDGERRVMRLLGFRAEAPEVQQIGGLLELEPPAAAGPTALLQKLNCWTAADVELYLQHVRQLRQQRGGGEQWRLDLGLLSAFGIPVPPSLQPLCV
ncbi:hypothetical protein ACK3TF_002835 [Chlorella vulgaris]